MLHQSETYREVIVEPANSWKELALVFTAVLIITRVFFLQESEQNLLLQEYQKLDTNLTDRERPLYQALVSSQNEIIMMWQESGGWPTIELLNEEGIPPFASDLMPGNLKKFKWVRYDRGPWVDYLGTAPVEAANLPTVLLRIMNLHADFHPHPHPGRDYDPDQNAVVQIWMHPEKDQHYPGMRLPERGWFWIISPASPVLSSKSKL